MEVLIIKICDILNNNESENLLKEWLEFREEKLSRMDEHDQKHLINFYNYSENILNNVSGENYNYISKKLDLIYEDFIEYCAYWDDKYYISGFSDAIKLIVSELKL